MITLQDRFASILNQLNLPTASKLCVALSGGSDSMCLTFLLKEWCSATGHELFTVTVDHHLRSESSEEAQKVGAWMAAYGISHTILEWPIHQHSAHVTQQEARDARYDLLIKHCQKNHIPCLLTAHHQDDQAETLLMRFLKGSDITGLSGIPVFSYQQGICLIRPLLHISKEEILYFLKENGVPYVEDPSNQKDTYLRNRLRDFLTQEKIPPARFSTLAHKFSKISSYFNSQVERFAQENVILNEIGYLSFPIAAFRELHPVMREKVLTHLLRVIGETQYPPRSHSTEHLVSQMSSASFTVATLNGCEVHRKDESFYISREIRKSFPISFTEREICFDDRFVISISKIPADCSLKDLTARYLTPQDIAVLKAVLPDLSLEKIPSFLRRKLIGIFLQKNLVSVPQICYFKDGWQFYIKFLRNLKQKLFTAV